MSTGLLNLLHARQGHFKLESGHHGNLWLELDRLFLKPNALQPFVVELARRLSAFKVKAVCGPMAGGALIAHGIALELGVDFLYTERTPPQTPDGLFSASYTLPAPLRPSVRGLNVAIVDDVINAGSAVRGTLADLESLGARTVVIGALLVLGETGRSYFMERNLAVESVAQLPNELWTPKECPLCLAQIPLDRVD